MRAVNLLPKDAERARRTTPDPSLLIGVAGLAIVLAALFSMYLGASQKVQDRKDKRVQAQQTYDLLIRHNPPPKVLAVQQTVASLEGERISAVSSALSYRVPWSNILGQLALVMPSGVKLTSLAATTPVSPNTQFAASATATPTAGTSSAGMLTLSGWAYSPESVFLFLTRLKILPPISAVTLNSNPINSATTPVTWNFSISAQIRTPGVTP
ncbi:MAG: PilN domain-containing protein [Gaiellaceae bacterium]